MGLLTQNSELAPDRIWNWTLPAWHVTLADGTRFKTCPHAGICAQYCYARNGTYLFRNVIEAHTRNLTFVLDDRKAWLSAMTHELSHQRFVPTGRPRQLPITIDHIDPVMREWCRNGGAAVRIHDSGDFFAEWYLELWLLLASRFPHILFYAYTKEVQMLKQRAQSPMPRNFRYLFSTGGTQDHMIEADADRHADVFPNEQALAEAGYSSQDQSDLLAILLPTTRIGIPANNIPQFNKKLNGRRFSEAVPVNLRLTAPVTLHSPLTAP